MIGTQTLWYTDRNSYKNSNMSISLGRVTAINSDLTVQVKPDGETGVLVRVYPTSDGADFGTVDPRENGIPNKDRETYGSRILPKIGSRVIVGFVNGWDVFAFILKYLPNLKGNRKDGTPVKDEFTKGEGFIHQTGTQAYFLQNGDIEITHKSGIKILIEDDKITLNSGDEKDGVVRIGDATLSNSSTDSTYWAFIAALLSIMTGPNIPEPGNGAPSAFQIALKAAIAANQPTSLTGKTNEGSDKVFA